MKYAFLSVLLVISICTSLGAPLESPSAAAKETRPHQIGERFLFIVDTTASMRRLEHDGRQALFNMIFTGLDGYMRQGDTYGVWTFSEEVNAGSFPMQIWRTNDLLHLASQATFFVKKQNYSNRKGRLDRTVRAGLSVIRMVEDVNIIIISDENERMEGTPFDQLVNDLYKKLATALRTAKKPIITTLVARNGAMVNATVTLADEPLFLPPRPDPEPAPVQTTNSTSAVVSQVTQTKPAKVKVPKPPRGNIIMTGSVKEAAPRITPPSAPASPAPPTRALDNPNPPDVVMPITPDPSSGPLITGSQDPVPTSLNNPPSERGPPQNQNQPAEPDPSPGFEPVTPSTQEQEHPSPVVAGQTSHKTPPSPGEKPGSMETESQPDRSSLSATLATLSPRSQTVAAREPPPATSATDSEPGPGSGPLTLTGMAGLPVQSKTDAILWLVGGVGFLVLALALAVVFLKLRRQSHQPSVITQSLTKH